MTTKEHLKTQISTIVNERDFKTIFKVYSLGEIETFTKMYKSYQMISFGEGDESLSNSLNERFVKDFVFGKEDHEIFCSLDNLSLDEVFEFTDWLGTYTCIFENTTDDEKLNDLLNEYINID